MTKHSVKVMRDIWFEVLEDVAAFAQPARDRLRFEVPYTDRRRDNETTAEFRRGLRDATWGRCACGIVFPPAHGRRERTRCAICQLLHLRQLRAARDKSRKR